VVFRQLGLGQFIGTSAGLNSAGEELVIEKYTIFNIYGQYEFGDDHKLLNNKEPPLSSIVAGLRSRYYSPRQRYLYANCPQALIFLAVVFTLVTKSP